MIARNFDAEDLPKKLLWLAVAAGVTTLGARAVRGGLERAWRLALDDEPPADAASPEVPWREAILWTVTTGVVVGLGQLLVRRGLESGWHRLTGEHPPV